MERPDGTTSSNRSASAASEGASSNVRWRILLLIVVASFVSYFLRTNMSIAGPIMIEELGLTEMQLGIVLSAFALGYTIFQFPGGIFGDVVGPRLAVTLMAVAWGLLAVSILSAVYASQNPWSHSWIYEYWSELGWIRY